LIFTEGPPAGHYYLPQVYHVNNIISHRWNEAINQYEFEVTWQRCNPTDTTWETANSFNPSTSARRCLIQYLNTNLPEADANKIRILSAGTRKRTLIRNEEEEDPLQDFTPEEDVICTKRKEVPTAGLESSLLEPEEMSEGEFEKMTEDDLEAQYFTGVPDRTTWRKIRKLCSPVKTVRGWWDGQKEKVDAKDRELPWERYCQPRSEEFDSLTKDICIKTFGQGKLYANDPQLPLDSLFKNPLWHPGKSSQTTNRCVIDAINLYFGGAVYDTCEKFFAYYAFTKKMKTHHVPEDILLKGISFTNLHNVVVLKD
jgi:hypothetical protein